MIAFLNLGARFDDASCGWDGFPGESGRRTIEVFVAIRLTSASAVIQGGMSGGANIGAACWTTLT
jgi:hypothetical protein